ncbi:MAG: diguanylate cyclase [Chloroflexota bacterium]|nr:MAG: hypothetical protein DLM70_01305 [Chloroflexota bacterium]
MTMRAHDLDGGVPVPQQERLQTLNEISRVLASMLDLRTLYDTIYEQIGRVMDASQFFIALHQSGQPTFDVPYLREDGKLGLDDTAPYGDNVTSLVIAQGSALIYGTAEEYEEYERGHGLSEGLVGEQTSESGIFVPLNTGSRTIGALTVQTMRRHAYTEEDMGMLSVIASQAAVAIENARLYAESQEAVRRTQAILHVARTISGSLDLATVLDSILTGMRDVLPFYLAAVLLPDHAGEYLEIAGRIGPPDGRGHETIKISIGEGVTGRVFQTGEPMVVPDVRSSTDYVSDGSGHVRSELAVPLRRGENVVGVLNIERQEVNGFSQDDLNLLSLFASQAAIAIENARLFRELRNRVSDLQTIQSVVQQLTPVHEIPAIASVINLELKTLIDYHSWRLFIVDPDGQALVPISIHGPLSDRRLTVGEGVTGWIAQYGQSVLIDNLLHDPRSAHIAGTPSRPESMIGAPLLYEGSVRGAITLSKLGVRQFDQNSLRLLEIVAAQMAIAFDRAHLYQELRAEAITDPLTSLYNRRYLSERYVEERSRALRNQHTLAAMMVDIDKFKHVNDTYGHDAGDLVLQDLARIIRTTVRAEDIVARYGGEEFCILLPEIPPDDAVQLGSRLRDVIEQHDMPNAAGVQRITVSVGIALLRPGDDTMEVFARADQAMYRVKRAGGNRVCLDNGGDVSMVG